MKKSVVFSVAGLLMFLALALSVRAQILVDITAEFKGKSYHCKTNPMDSCVSQVFSTPAKGFVRMTTVYYPSAARTSKGGVQWSADGKNWAAQTAMGLHYFRTASTNYWELRKAGKSGPGKRYTEWYVYEVNPINPVKNWHAAIFPNYDPSLDGCTGTQYASNTRLIIECSDSGFPQPPDETALAPGSSAAPVPKSTAWRGVIPSQNLRYQYQFAWSGDNFTAKYVGIDNPSVFQGKMSTSGGETFLEFVQTDPRNPKYKATYKLKQVGPGKFAGTMTDYTGTFPVELTADTPPPAADPGVVGSWVYRTGNFTDVHIFSADGTLANAPTKTRWSIQGGKLTVHHDNPDGHWVNEYAYTPGADRLEGVTIDPRGNRMACTLTRKAP